MAEASLHSDTVGWLEKRNAARTALGSAYTSTGEAVEEEQDSPAAEAPDLVPEEGEEGDGEGVVGVAAGEPDCELTPGGCSSLNAAFAELPSETDVEQEEDGNGWPNSDGLYSDVMTTLKSKDQMVMPDAIVQQRQINTLESYRRMLLHKKQRRCHLLAAFAKYWESETQSQTELQQLMLNQKVGVTGNAVAVNTGEDGAEDENAEEGEEEEEAAP